MKCKTCEEQGLKSTVYVGYTTTTCMYSAPFYDEEGRYHNHDPNKTTTSYSCSNGHTWYNTSYASCWCGWGK